MSNQNRTVRSDGVHRKNNALRNVVKFAVLKENSRHVKMCEEAGRKGKGAKATLFDPRHALGSNLSRTWPVQSG